MEQETQQQPQTAARIEAGEVLLSVNSRERERERWERAEGTEAGAAPLRASAARYANVKKIIGCELNIVDFKRKSSTRKIRARRQTRNRRISCETAVSMFDESAGEFKTAFSISSRSDPKIDRRSRNPHGQQQSENGDLKSRLMISFLRRRFSDRLSPSKREIGAAKAPQPVRTSRRPISERMHPSQKAVRRKQESDAEIKRSAVTNYPQIIKE